MGADEPGGILGNGSNQVFPIVCGSLSSDCEAMEGASEIGGLVASVGYTCGCRRKYPSTVGVLTNVLGDSTCE